MWKKIGLAIFVLLLTTVGMADALDLLKGVMPGKVSRVHEKYEGRCLDCHDLVQKVFYDKCLACHKEVKKDVELKTGFHGKSDSTRCETCHSEHKGRESHLVQFDSAHFDHGKTQFELTGKHQTTKCDRCHLKPKFRETPHDCFSCHLEKDKHKGALGKACERCHNSEAWKKISFDHSRTRFPLEGKHAPVACEKCHASDNFKATPTACIGCHLNKDKHKGVLGKQCESCHSAKDWKAIVFDHDKTEFKLLGSHQKVECLKCHKTPQLRETPKNCVECHKRVDPHKGVLGPQCAQCHTVKDWKDILFDHDKTRFALMGKHQTVECQKCHTTPDMKATPKVCVECHKKDDYHKGKLGRECDRCHMAENWKRIGFDHSKTDYPLVGKHLDVPCTKCHIQEAYKIPSQCSSCHRSDDKHKGRLGESCETCHSEKGWKDIQKFDHQKTSFQLLDKHREVRCSDCHKTALFKDTSSVCNDCHVKDDYHKGRFGTKCETCHTAKTWKRDDFNHAKETGYPLVQKHSQLKCEQCHVKQLYAQKTSRMCVRCHLKDDIHEGELGTRCEICHSEVGFKVIKRLSSEDGYFDRRKYISMQTVPDSLRRVRVP
jgi:hypothetical protein